MLTVDPTIPPPAEDLAKIKTDFAALFARTLTTWAMAGAPAGNELIESLAGAATEWLARYEANIAALAEGLSPSQIASAEAGKTPNTVH